MSDYIYALTLWIYNLNPKLDVIDTFVWSLQFTHNNTGVGVVDEETHGSKGLKGEVVA